MPVIRLSSLDDPRLADYRMVRDPELVRARQLFLAEGRQVVQRLLATRRYTIRSLLLSDAAYAALGPTLARELQPQPRASEPQAPEPTAPEPTAPEPTAPEVQNPEPPAPSPQPPAIYICRSADFTGLTGIDFHRGCLALVERPRPSTVDEVIDDASLVIAMEAVANPDNVGGIFRNAAAFGVDAVLLSPTSCDPLYRKAIRTSMAATLRIPFARIAPWPDGLLTLRAAGFEIAALTPRRPSQTLADYCKGLQPARLALLLGAEGAGLSAAAESMADVRIRIPIATDVDSLNVAVAAGIALARLTERSPGPELGGID